MATPGILHRTLLRAALIGGAALPVLCQAAARCDPPAEIEAQRSANTPARFSNIAGAWFARHENLTCAIALFENALDASPNLAEAHYNLGLALLEGNRLSEARREFEFLVETAPGQGSPAESVLAWCSKRGQSRRGPKRNFVRPLSSIRDPLPLCADWARCSKSRNATRRPITYLKQAAGSGARRAGASDRTGRSMYENGTRADAIRILQETAAAHARSAVVQAQPRDIVRPRKALRRGGRSISRRARARSLRQRHPACRWAKRSSVSIAMPTPCPCSPRCSHISRVIRKRIIFEASHTGELPNTKGCRGSSRGGRCESARLPVPIQLRIRPRPPEQPEEARVQLEKARELQPDSQEAQFQLANVLRRLNQRETARKQLAEFEQSKKRTQMERCRRHDREPSQSGIP